MSAEIASGLGPFEGLPETTLCLIVDSFARPTRLLLGAKKRGLGEGKVVGIGGHVERGEAILEAAVREVREEVCIELDAALLRAVARIEFEFPHRSAWRMASNVFLAELPSQAEPCESEEVRPYWFSVTDLPHERMWDDARYWLPRVLAGESLNGWFEFGLDNQRVARMRIAPRVV